MPSGGAAALVARADEGEVVVGEPLEERRRLGDIAGVGGGRRRCAQVRRELERAVAHRVPVVDDDTHVGEHRLDGGSKRVEDRTIALAVDLRVHEQRAVDDRMEQQVHLVAIAREQLR